MHSESLTFHRLLASMRCIPFVGVADGEESEWRIGVRLVDDIRCLDGIY